MSLTLSKGDVVCALPADLIWADEFTDPIKAQSRKRTLDGALIIEESALIGGRAITLDGGDHAWVERQVIEQLRGLAALPAPFALVLPDGRSFSVAFEHSKGAFKALPVWPADRYDATAPYTLTVYLLII